MNIEADLGRFISSEMVGVMPEGGVTQSKASISSGKADSLGRLQIPGSSKQNHAVTWLASGSPQRFCKHTDLVGCHT